MAGPIDAKHLDLVGMHLADEKNVTVNDNLLRAAAADDFLIGTIVAEIGDLSWDRQHGFVAIDVDVPLHELIRGDLEHI
jgi:hypothetical protein